MFLKVYCVPFLGGLRNTAFFLMKHKLTFFPLVLKGVKIWSLCNNTEGNITCCPCVHEKEFL